MTRKRIAHRLSCLLGTAALLVSAAAVAGRLAWAQQPAGVFPAAPARTPRRRRTTTTMTIPSRSLSDGRGGERFPTG